MAKARDQSPSSRMRSRRGVVPLFSASWRAARTFGFDLLHLLRSQALQQMEVFYGNHRGQIFTPAGDYRPLLSAGGAIYDRGKLFPRFRDAEACHKFARKPNLCPTPRSVEWARHR
jgi:hypothetical protein